jgi:hypothetical protein
LSGAAGSHGGRRAADLIVPGLAVLMCGGLLLHTGAASIGAAAVLTVVGYALTFRRGVRELR